jgi:hypothetical protein
MDTDQHESAFDDAMSARYAAMTRNLSDPNVDMKERIRRTYTSMSDCGFAFADCGAGRIAILNVPPWFFNDRSIWLALHAIQGEFCAVVFRVLAHEGKGVDERAAALWLAERQTLRDMLTAEFEQGQGADADLYADSFRLLDVLRIQPIRTIRHVLG